MHALLHALIDQMPAEGEQLTAQQRNYWLHVIEVNLEVAYPEPLYLKWDHQPTETEIEASKRSLGIKDGEQ